MLRTDYAGAIRPSMRSEIWFKSQDRLERWLWSVIAFETPIKGVTIHQFKLGLEELQDKMSFHGHIPHEFIFGKAPLKMLQSYELSLQLFFDTLIREAGVKSIQDLAPEGFGTVIEHAAPHVCYSLTATSISRIWTMCLILFIDRLMKTCEVLQ